ncbi:MAG TPA: sn-glycerol-3-phosphate ABC transporter ATP-binding protein UgpC [Geminicoccaceae bacterium]|nr:sn-glycerol-3-phosphate ABC transporter ATP-binding protein UgpC [Geminicoccus sp.]HMU52545.1 sn-glycerol-3-phosphate ABC transporter ATP-binding protein UgpC [Geminicoccaceae bacterium]
MATLELEKVVKRYGDAAVIHGVDLRVESGEFCVFVGPSGCGKSTLLRMIAGLEPITDGEIRIDGARVNELGAAGRGLAMVFQSYALYPHMTVRQNLAFGLENVRTPQSEIDRRVGEAARMLQIEPLLGRRPKQLSGGQRQRVAIGRAVVREPKIFLFDEPLSNLDAELRVQMRVELSDLHGRLGNTMIYVTHDQVEAMTMADRIVVLRLGHVEQVGRPLELYNRPVNRFVAGFIGSPRMNFLEGRIARADGSGVLVEVPGLPAVAVPVDGSACGTGEPVTLGVRPGSISLVDGDGAEARVDTTEQLGSESYLYCSLPQDQKLAIHHPGQTRIGRGDTIRIAFDPAACHLFRTVGGEPALPHLD